MNRICIQINEHGEIAHIVADQPIEIYFVDEGVPSDRVYQYGSADIGPEHVRHMIGGYSVGHANDGRLGGGDGTGRRSPSTPDIGLVE